MSTRTESNGARFRFWLVAALAVVGIGIAAFVVFLLVVRAVYAWGFLGAFLFIALVFLGYGWLYDRRHRRDPADDDY